MQRAVAKSVAEAGAGLAPGERVDVVEAVLGDLSAGELTVVLSPSLFGGARAAVLRGAEDAGKEVVAELAARTAALDADTAVVVTHSGAARGKAVLEALDRAGARTVRCERVTTTGARLDFLTSEIRTAGGRITAEAAGALLRAVGNDLRELATACGQLVADSGGSVDEAVVARYHLGRADASGFTVADRAVEGDAPGALEVLRWAFSTGLAPVLVTSSLAANLRLIAKVAAEGRGHPARIAKAVGQPTWKVERAMRWARGWSPAGLSVAVTAVASADAEVKGAAVDDVYAAERAVLAVTAARSRR